MNKSDTYLDNEVIEAYVAGTMPAAKRNAFEAQMAKDESLRNEVRLYKLTIAALRHHGAREDRLLGEALQSMSRDELKSMLEQQRKMRLDVAACACPEPAAEAKERGGKHLVTTIVIMLVAFAAIAWWYMHR